MSDFDTPDSKPVPCRVCRRPVPQCICTSVEGPRPGKSESQVDILVRTAMKFYYDRDATGLAAYIRMLIK